jgi:DNA polymerase III subunit epsilon
MKQRKYAIVDLETTGGMAKRDKVVEIGIVISDGQRVLETFETLVNPERSIPMDVIRIHGITDEMVRDAPKFYEIAKKVIELTEDCVFVAHNVLFDYGFVRSEFEALGFTYTRSTLCTVRLSRKAFTGLPSYGLSNLSRHFGIHISNRHRALDDAMATGIIFHKILEVVTLDTHLGISMKSQIKEARYPEGISEETIRKLPTTAGVYYFYNEYERVIYVGKSINIQARVKQHFSDFTPKYEKLFQRVKMIDFVETGTEILALLLEDYEIKSLGPEINKAQRNKPEKYFSHYFADSDGYIQIGILPIQKAKNMEPIS